MKTSASVPVSLAKAHRGAQWFRGMVMSTKEIVLFAWILTVMLLSVLLSHFWSYTMFVIQKAVAFGMLPLLAASRLAAAIMGIPSFP